MSLKSVSEMYPAYLHAVEDFLRDENHFRRFKTDTRYQRILEHVSPELGKAYLAEIMKYPDARTVIQKSKDNDRIGQAQLCDFPFAGPISPSTLRYAKVACDLRALFGDLTGAHIVEIGAGYGGQMLVADRLLQFESYTMIDLPAVVQLIRKYLAFYELRGRVSSFALATYAPPPSIDLVISNYGFSELPPALQIEYIEKILSRAQRGYLTMNSGLNSGLNSDSSHSAFRNHLSLEDLRRRLPPLRVVEETPLSGAGNYILVWG